MHLLVISLLTILAGTLLLAKFKKENQGKLFKVISWFFIIVGLLLFIVAVWFGSCGMEDHGCKGKQDCRHEMMMNKCGPGMQAGCCQQGMMKSGCCMQGMDKGNCCCMGAMGKGMCMPKDSMMQNCPMHMGKDTVATKPK